MRFLATILCGVGVASPSAAAVGLRDAIHALTGNKRVRVVWARDTDPSGDEVYGGVNRFKLMGYDSHDDAVVEIMAALDDYSRPTITSDGTRVVFTDRVQDEIVVVDWEGTGRRVIRGGMGRRDTGTIWHDPLTHVEWVYFEEGDNSGNHYLTNGKVMRVNLDDPSEVELVWDQTLSSHGFVAVSSDGARLGGSFPWPESGVIAPFYDGSGAGDIWKWTSTSGMLARGCWPTITPDQRYIYGVFNAGGDGILGGSHRGWKVWDPPYTGAMRVLDLHQVPGNSGWEVFHPRMSNHPQFVTVTGPYTSGEMGANNILAGGPQIEVFLGKIDPGFTEVTDWIQVTSDNRADIYPYAWVAPTASPPVRIDDFSATPAVIVEGGTATLEWETHHASLVSIVPSIGTVVATGSVSVSPSSTTTYTLTVDGVDGPRSATATVSVVSLSLPLAIDCGGAPPAPGWVAEDVFRTGGDRLDLPTSVDPNGQSDPAPDAVYQTCIHGDHSYSIPLANGTHTVRLHFLDTAAGRAMDFSLEGARVLDDLDIVAEAGGPGKACVREFVLAIKDGDGLQIVATKDGGNDVLLSGIEIVEGGTLDTTRPTIAIDAPLVGEVHSGSVEVFGTASDEVAVALVEVRVDDGTWMKATGTTVWSHTISQLAFGDGVHTIEARAIDPSGNQALAAVEITTRNRPSVTIVRPQAGDVWEVGSIQTIVWTAENLDDVTIRYSLDGGETFVVANPSIASSDPEWGSWTWVVPSDAATARAAIEIHGYFDSSVRDQSALFAIANERAGGGDLIGVSCAAARGSWLAILCLLGFVDTRRPKGR